jgi:hypothetical protein
MATIPSFERLLLQIHQSLDLDSYPSKIKAQFADLGLETENHQKKLEEMLDAIFRALDMDPLACRDALQNLMEWSVFQKAVELHTWTSDADERQVLWHMLGYSYAPSLGRRIAFWNLEGAFDKGMPGGEFWFLPHIDPVSRTVKLPVPSVVKWLLDLLDLPMDCAKEQLGGTNKDQEDKKDSIERNLYNWLSGTIPRSSTINEYFQLNSELDFRGCFELAPDLPNVLRLTKAFEFISRKGLNAEKLRDQISMTQPGRIEAILDGSASDEEKQLVVELLLVRYAKPSAKLIRQRFLSARMAQDGYRRLLKRLCPDVKESCANPAENKLLQLISIFGASYNATINAWKNSETRDEEDALFESQLPPWDKEDIFLCVLPSRFDSAYKELAAILSRRFAQLQPGEALEDLVTLDASVLPGHVRNKAQRLMDELEADKRCIALIDRLRTGSPWRILSEVNDYWIVSQIAQDSTLSTKARDAAIRRMRELASSPSQVIGAICIQLNDLLNCSTKDRPADAQHTVDNLLAEARQNPAYIHWKAPLLQYEAKHCLALNDISTAATFFREALDACSERNFGPARGEIARDALACAVANQRLIPGNHEKFFRNMRDYGIFEGEPPTLEDAARLASEYFWTDLYKPYPKLQNLRPIAALQAESYITETIPLIFEGNQEGLREWLRLHAKEFRKDRIKDVRGDTVLMSWIKMRNFFTSTLPALKAAVPLHLQHEVNKVKRHMDNWRQAILLLIAAWPEQANLPDFKGQTALMLAADADDEVLVKALLSAGAELNSQDYKGRTPLHAAITGRSEKCAVALLIHNPDTRKISTDGGQTVLHTAVRMADTKIIQLLLTHEPSLAERVNQHNQTALTLAENILVNLERFQAYMASERRYVGSRDEFEAVIATLKEQPTIH